MTVLTFALDVYMTVRPQGKVDEGQEKKHEESELCSLDVASDST